jgi:hypothetical protein
MTELKKMGNARNRNFLTISLTSASLSQHYKTSIPHASRQQRERVDIAQHLALIATYFGLYSPPFYI